MVSVDPLERPAPALRVLSEFVLLRLGRSYGGLDQLQKGNAGFNRELGFVIPYSPMVATADDRTLRLDTVYTLPLMIEPKS